ncbi:MAG: xanthine dehydrogenase family protein subunit M [Actinomycetota bacterium]|jgi:carbon-monoxide dehydrogenase medium subunit|nr:xanthine dehydrogenase family protein subunit M [Actinomycetota bacterium]
MIPADFEYLRVDSPEAAVEALVEHGDEAKILAGGHSLLPLMRLRLAYPEVLIDVTRVDSMRGVTDEGDTLLIGACTTHHDVAHDRLIQAHCGILSEATATVGDPQVRHRGTIGGALAHADAAGDLPTVVLALDGQLVAQGPNGSRGIAAADFFVDYLQTVLEPDEVLTGVRVPKLATGGPQGSGWGYHYEKFNRVAQAWAIVASCALVRRDNGTIREARVALTNMGPTPVRATATESALAGAALDAVADAAARAADGTDPPTDLNAKPDYRRHLAQVLTRRALERALGA